MTANNPSGIKRLNNVLAAMAPPSRSVKSGAHRRLAHILDADQTALHIRLRVGAAPLIPKPIPLGQLDRLLDRRRRDPVRAKPSR